MGKVSRSGIKGEEMAAMRKWEDRRRRDVSGKSGKVSSATAFDS